MRFGRRAPEVRLANLRGKEPPLDYTARRFRDYEIAPYAIILGNPARLPRQRFSPEIVDNCGGEIGLAIASAARRD